MEVGERYLPTVCGVVNTEKDSASGLNLELESEGGISQGHGEAHTTAFMLTLTHTYTHTAIEIQVCLNHRLPWGLESLSLKRSDFCIIGKWLVFQKLCNGRFVSSLKPLSVVLGRSQICHEVKAEKEISHAQEFQKFH